MRKPRSMLVKLTLPIFLAVIMMLTIAIGMIFYTYSQSFISSTIQSNIEIIDQTRYYLEFMHHSLTKMVSSISGNQHIYKTLTNDIGSIHDEFDSRYQLSQMFKEMPAAIIDYELVVVGKNRLGISSGNGGVYSDSELLVNNSNFDKIRAYSPKIYYTYMESGPTYSTKNQNVIIGCKALLSSTGETYGAVYIVIRESSLKSFYSNFTRNGTNIILLSAEGTVLSATGPYSFGSKNSSLLNGALSNREQGVVYHQTQENQIVISQYMPYLDSYIVSEMDLNTILSQYYQARNWLIGFSVMILLFLLTIIVMIVNRNLSPLKKLSHTMADSKSIVPQPISISSSSEIEIVSNAYNAMVEKLNDYLKQLDVEYSERREVELNLLQMQINPHFLYNTLGSIKYMVARNNEEQACCMITSLIELLRSTLNQTGAMVTVEEEIKNVRNYINIMSPRYGGFITTNLQIQEECLPYKVPNLILQPFVENSFFHAFQKNDMGTINLFITKSGENLICEVIDNGDGIEPEILQTISCAQPKDDSKPGSRIGVANVRERLERIYPGDSPIRIISQPDYGTSVIITIPAMK